MNLLFLHISALLHLLSWIGFFHRSCFSDFWDLGHHVCSKVVWKLLINNSNTLGLPVISVCHIRCEKEVSSIVYFLKTVLADNII